MTLVQAFFLMTVGSLYLHSDFDEKGKSDPECEFQ